MNAPTQPPITAVFSEIDKNAKLALGWTVLSAEHKQYSDEISTHERIIYVMQAPEEK